MRWWDTCRVLWWVLRWISSSPFHGSFILVWWWVLVFQVLGCLEWGCGQYSLIGVVQYNSWWMTGICSWCKRYCRGRSSFLSLGIEGSVYFLGGLVIVRVWWGGGVGVLWWRDMSWLVGESYVLLPKGGDVSWSLPVGVCGCCLWVWWCVCCLS